MRQGPDNPERNPHSDLPGEGTRDALTAERVPEVDVSFGSVNLTAPEGQDWKEWVITRGIEAADQAQEDHPIDHRAAYYIADWLRDDRSPALRNFVLTGVIDGPGIQEELTHHFFGQTQQVQTWIGWFAHYCIHREDRGPVEHWRDDIDRQDRADVEQVRRERIVAEPDILFQMVPAHQRVGNGSEPGWHGRIRYHGHPGGLIVSEGEPGMRRVWATDSDAEFNDAWVEIVQAQRQWILETLGGTPGSDEEGISEKGRSSLGDD